ncbi:hypothetical protein NMY22_g20183 [Coprinellus aureogranulatus]|nr:hypothetical protein NMY22_g20183 [Coprinellus aureogranulatus]
MPRCTRKGCGKEFEVGKAEACTFHPGAPVFHEGLKSWSCCKDFNKPVLDFDEFMSISGCTETDSHSIAAPEKPSEPSSTPITNSNVTSTRDSDGKETFSVGGSRQPQAMPQNTTADAPKPAAPAQLVEDEDDAEGFQACCPAGGVSDSSRRETIRRRIESEQKRRDELCDGYVRLKETLPSSIQKSSKFLCSSLPSATSATSRPSMSCLSRPANGVGRFEEIYAQFSKLHEVTPVVYGMAEVVLKPRSTACGAPALCHSSLRRPLDPPLSTLEEPSSSHVESVIFDSCDLTPSAKLWTWTQKSTAKAASREWQQQKNGHSADRMLTPASHVFAVFRASRWTLHEEG